MLYTVFVIPSCVAKNFETILICRFLCAFMGSVTISNAPGSLGDIFPEEWRTLAFSVFCIAPMNGPVIGPIGNLLLPIVRIMTDTPQLVDSCFKLLDGDGLTGSSSYPPPFSPRLDLPSPKPMPLFSSANAPRKNANKPAMNDICRDGVTKQAKATSSNS